MSEMWNRHFNHIYTTNYDDVLQRLSSSRSDLRAKEAFRNAVHSFSFLVADERLTEISVLGPEPATDSATEPAVQQIAAPSTGLDAGSLERQERVFRDVNVRISSIFINGGLIALMLAIFSIISWYSFGDSLINVSAAWLIVAGAPFLVWMGKLFRSYHTHDPAG